MGDIYGRQVEFGDAFASDRMTINFSGFGVGLLMQNLSWNYNQQITRIWELGSKKTYFVGGRTAGTFAANQIAGPSGTTEAFLTQYGNICNAASNTLQVSYTGGWCAGSARGGYTLHNVVIQQVATQVSANDMLINDNVQGIFNWMSR